MVLGKTEHKFSFPLKKKSIDIFGMNIDDKLSFDNSYIYYLPEDNEPV